MAQSDDQTQIRNILARLATVDQGSGDLLTLASGIKESQKNLRFALQGAIKLIGALNANRTDMTALLDSANQADAAFGRNNQFKTQLRDLLNQGPSSQESQAVIDELKSIVNSQRMIDRTNLAIPNDAENRNIRTTLDIPPPAQAVGGFNWRSQSNRPKKSTRITRRRSKSKIKSRRTTRNKRKKSIRKSKSKSN